MPWRLIGIIAILAVLLGFIGFNLGNTCNLSLGFAVFYRVPVYVTVFVSFMLGLLFSIPFFIAGTLKRKSKKDKFPKDNPSEPTTPNKEPYGID